MTCFPTRWITIPIRPITFRKRSRSCSSPAWVSFCWLKSCRRRPRSTWISTCFVRGLVSGFYWFARRPLQSLDLAWGEFYRTVVLRILMALARFFAWFDRWGIDGVVDNVAYGTRDVAEKIRVVQSGNIQYYLALALAVIFAIVGVYLLT